MNNKEILNIVKFSVVDSVGGTTTTRTQAAVFYKDGSVEMVPMEDAIDLAKKQNKKIIQDTPERLEKNFQTYRTSEVGFTKKKKETKQEKTSLFKKIKNGLGTLKNILFKPFSFLYSLVVKGCAFATLHILQRDKLKKLKEQQKENGEEEEKEEKKGFFQKLKKRKEKNGEKKRLFSRRKKSKAKKKKRKKRKRLSTRIKAIALAAVLTVAGALGFNACHNSNNNTKSKVESTSNDLDNLTKDEIIKLISEYKLTADQVAMLIQDGKITNDDFSNLSYEQLLYITSSDTQREAMNKVSQFLDNYNITFADKCLDANSADIRTSLTWDEVNALNLAYNDYSREEVAAMFNDAEAIDFTNAYKEGYLQLLGAYVLATDKNPVQLSQLVDSTEGKEFVNKYENSLYECKSLTGQAQINSINIFLQRVVDDFSINAKEKQDIESYKLAVAPIVGAAVSLFQDLEVNQTTLDQVTTYFNTLGLYDQATENLNMAKSLTGEETEENPIYEQYKNKKIEELKAANVYYVNDKKRDLSQLSSFTSLVEWHFNLDESGNLKIGNTLDESIVRPEPETKVEQVQAEEVVLASAPTPQVQARGEVQQSANNNYTIQGSPYHDEQSANIEGEPVNTEEEPVDTEGVVVDYDPAEEWDNFQVDQAGDQTIISYDEESEEQNTQEQVPEASDENSSSNDTSTEDTTEETIPEDYTMTQMPDSDIYIMEYEEVVSETPQEGTTNEEMAEAIVQDMAENPDAYVDLDSYSLESEFVYQK